MKVSLITVCFNAESTIERTLKSVLEQTYDDIEYIIIDGASKDRTVEIAESWRQRFAERNIDYKIFSEPDKGIYDAMNKGIAKATGELVGIINADDWYEKDCVEVVVSEYEKSPFDLSFADIRMHMNGGKTFIKKARYRKYLTSRDWNHPTQFVRREVYDKYRYRCRNISDDMELYFRVRMAGYRIHVIHRTLANFQMGGVSSRIPITEIPERIGRRYQIYRENGCSRFYFLECAAFELIKYLASKF